MNFKSVYSYLTWKAFTLTGNPYAIEECILEELRIQENSLGKDR